MESTEIRSFLEIWRLECSGTDAQFLLADVTPLEPSPVPPMDEGLLRGVAKYAHGPLLDAKFASS